MSFTAAQATTLLLENPNNYATKEALLNLVRQLEVDSPGSNTLLYSGNSGSFRSEEIAKAAQGDFRIINGTEAAKFLDVNQNAVLRNHLRTMIGGDPLTKGTLSNAFLFDSHASEGAWAIVSENFAKSASGDVRTITPFATADRIFAQTELPALLGNINVTSI